MQERLCVLLVLFMTTAQGGGGPLQTSNGKHTAGGTRASLWAKTMILAPSMGVMGLRGGGVRLEDVSSADEWRIQQRSKIHDMKVDEIKAALKARGLTVGGSKAELARR